MVPLCLKDPYNRGEATTSLPLLTHFGCITVFYAHSVCPKMADERAKQIHVLLLWRKYYITVFALINFILLIFKLQGSISLS